MVAAVQFRHTIVPDKSAYMSSIRILPDRVANQIAAGEVIERPVAVVKELVENSIDAGATRIEVEFRNGGKSYLRIADNGVGMSPDQALLSLERHATSKIKEAGDLHSINSFGFRGEALPSIASVSKFTMRTRKDDGEHGTEILVNGGKLLDKKDCGMPVGTVIEVAHLFNSVPARRKFLKTDATESAHITYTTRLFAVAHPHIAFRLLENGRVLFRSPACSNLTERIAEIWGPQLAKNLLPVKSEDTDAGLSLSGLTAKPGVGRATRRELVTLVNHRPVDNRTLGFAVLDAYHGRIQKGRYPPAFLFLRIDPDQVDINVHPAKREIRFRNESLIRRFVLESISQTLAREDQAHHPLQKTDVANSKAPEKPKPKEIPPAPLSTSKQPRLPKPLPAQSQVSIPEKSSHAVEKPAPQITPKVTQPVTTQPSATRINWRLITCLQGRYALFETGSGLIMMHIKHATERVRYEQLEADYDSAGANSQPLLIPLPLELEPVIKDRLVSQIGLLQRNGFAIEPFGQNFHRIEAIPSWLPLNEAEDFILDFLAKAETRDRKANQQTICREALLLLACKEQYREKPNLNEAAIKDLATQLLACRKPHTAPSGKPTFTEISWNDWKKRFGETNALH